MFYHLIPKCAVGYNAPTQYPFTNPVIDINLNLGSRGFQITGSADPLRRIGESIFALGDIQGDAIDDFAMMTSADNILIVVFGSISEAYGSVSISELLSGNEGFVVDVSAFGTSVTASGVGDINGDGIGDFAIGLGEGNSRRGLVYIVYGRRDFPLELDLESISSLEGFKILGSVRNGKFGYYMTSLRYVAKSKRLGVGCDDLVLGGSNECIVLFCSTITQLSSLGVLDMSDFNSTHGFSIYSSNFGQGYDNIVVMNIGDVNHDSISDFSLSFPSARSNTGLVHCIYGIRNIPVNFNMTLDNIDTSKGFSLTSSVSFASLGSLVSFGGDLNADGLYDVIIGSRYAGCYVLYGKNSSTFTSMELRADIDPTVGFHVHNSRGSLFTGNAVGGNVDLNADGFDDLVLGSPFDSANRYVYVLYGSSSMTTVDVSGMVSDGIAITSFAKIRTGYIVACGIDVNGDGRNDLLLGSSLYVSADDSTTAIGMVSIVTHIKGSSTYAPSQAPNLLPRPSRVPTQAPTRRPSRRQSEAPSFFSSVMTWSPSTYTPFNANDVNSSKYPFFQPTRKPSKIPLIEPSSLPSRNPSERPTSIPSNKPTRIPTSVPSVAPTPAPTSVFISSSTPTSIPTNISSISNTINDNSGYAVYYVIGVLLTFGVGFLLFHSSQFIFEKVKDFADMMYLNEIDSDKSDKQDIDGNAEDDDKDYSSVNQGGKDKGTITYNSDSKSSMIRHFSDAHNIHISEWSIPDQYFLIRVTGQSNEERIQCNIDILQVLNDFILRRDLNELNAIVHLKSCYFLAHSDADIRESAFTYLCTMHKMLYRCMSCTHIQIKDIITSESVEVLHHLLHYIFDDSVICSLTLLHHIVVLMSRIETNLITSELYDSVYLLSNESLNPIIIKMSISLIKKIDAISMACDKMSTIDESTNAIAALNSLNASGSSDVEIDSDITASKTKDEIITSSDGSHEGKLPLHSDSSDHLGEFLARWGGISSSESGHTSESSNDMYLGGTKSIAVTSEQESQSDSSSLVPSSIISSSQDVQNNDIGRITGSSGSNDSDSDRLQEKQEEIYLADNVSDDESSGFWSFPDGVPEITLSSAELSYSDESALMSLSSAVSVENANYSSSSWSHNSETSSSRDQDNGL